MSQAGCISIPLAVIDRVNRQRSELSGTLTAAENGGEALQGAARGGGGVGTRCTAAQEPPPPPRVCASAAPNVERNGGRLPVGRGESSCECGPSRMRSRRKVTAGGSGRKMGVLEYDGGDITQWLKGEEARYRRMDRVRLLS